MKIGNPLDKALGGIAPRTEGATTTTSSSKAKSSDGGIGQSATVTLSAAAAGLMAGQAGDFDAGKVSSVKQSIDDGTYEVNAEVIADKLISNARDLLQPRQAA